LLRWLCGEKWAVGWWVEWGCFSIYGYTFCPEVQPVSWHRYTEYRTVRIVKSSISFVHNKH
jgi:hypothetical protein